MRERFSSAAFSPGCFSIFALCLSLSRSSHHFRRTDAGVGRCAKWFSIQNYTPFSLARPLSLFLSFSTCYWKERKIHNAGALAEQDVQGSRPKCPLLSKIIQKGNNNTTLNYITRHNASIKIPLVMTVSGLMGDS